MKIKFVKTLKIHRAFIEIPIYKCALAIAYSKERKNLDRYLHGYGLTKSYKISPATSAVCWDALDDHACVVIATTLFPDTPNNIAQLSHEVLHAVFYILHNRMLTEYKDAQEAFCYLQEYLMREILNLFKR